MQAPLPLVRHAARPAVGKVACLCSRASSLSRPLPSLAHSSRPGVRQQQSRLQPPPSRNMASSCAKPPPTIVQKIPRSNIPILRTVEHVRKWRRPHMLEQRLVALVPTMGALHEGHLQLIRAAARDNHHVVVSIYVNPAQFGVTEDLNTYPSNWKADAAVLAALDRELADDGSNLGRISAVFLPSTEVMYPNGFPGQQVDSKGSFVTITPLAELLEGMARPTFFRGVATVVMKLFNIVQPERAYFGQKDIQQSILIRRMITDFMIPTQVVVVPTAREVGGLALSSRNAYLGTRRRRAAIVLYTALQAAELAYQAGALDRKLIRDYVYSTLDDMRSRLLVLPPQDSVHFDIDYVSLADPATLDELLQVNPAVGAVLSAAIRMHPVVAAQEGEDVGLNGGPMVRLLDNVILMPRTE